MMPTHTKTENTRNLGVQIDSGLRWDKQIEAVSNLTFRLIRILKSLRESASPLIFKMIFLALYQSVLGYYITV